MKDNENVTKQDGGLPSLPLIGSTAAEIPEHLQCGRIIKFKPNIQQCKKAIVWHYQWSDREGYSCDDLDCMKEAVKHHDGDHSYDQTGISWEQVGGSQSHFTPTKKHRAKLESPLFWETR